MKVKRNIKPNRYKPEVSKPSEKDQLGSSSIDFCLKWIMLIAGISLLSLAAIFGYDMVTQSKFFNIKKIHVTGNNRISDQEIIAFAELDAPSNIFKINRHSLEEKIASMPWIDSASIKRNMAAELIIQVREHRALAIVKIENIADIIINTQGRPFKEYNPESDHLEALPVIEGLDLTQADNGYLFEGFLFNAVMKFLDIAHLKPGTTIRADNAMGLSIEKKPVTEYEPAESDQGFPVKLGFGQYEQKLKKAETISEYMDRYFPDKKIIAMDLFDLEKVFVKTQLSDSGLNILEKGV